jgi:hypothetical protein
MGRGKARRSLELIEASIEILEAIQPATVRAVCYRLFILRAEAVERESIVATVSAWRALAGAEAGA